MGFAAFSVRNFQFTLVMFFMMAAIGLHAFKNIPRGEDPTFAIPVVSIVTVFPGADPSDMEKLVTEPIEQAINRIEDVKNIWSDSLTGAKTPRRNTTKPCVKSTLSVMTYLLVCVLKRSSKPALAWSIFCRWP